MVDASNSGQVVNISTPKEHWLARWATPIAVAMSLALSGAAFVSHGATQESDLKEAQADIRDIKAADIARDQKLDDHSRTLGALKQQGDDTNETVHTILDQMMKK